MEDQIGEVGYYEQSLNLASPLAEVSLGDAQGSGASINVTDRVIAGRGIA
jgi:hypothetical protein